MIATKNGYGWADDNDFLIGNQGYLDISWKPDQSTLEETPCFTWKTPRMYFQRIPGEEHSSILGLMASIGAGLFYGMNKGDGK